MQSWKDWVGWGDKGEQEDGSAAYLAIVTRARDNLSLHGAPRDAAQYQQDCGHHIPRITFLGLFPITSTTLSSITILILWLLLTWTQPSVTCPPAISWLLRSSLQGCHHTVATRLSSAAIICHQHLHLFCLLRWHLFEKVPRAFMSDSAAIPRFEPIVGPKQVEGHS